VLQRFVLLGRAAAKALQDSRLLDVPLSYVFYKCVLACTCISIKSHSSVTSSPAQAGGTHSMVSVVATAMSARFTYKKAFVVIDTRSRHIPSIC